MDTKIVGAGTNGEVITSKVELNNLSNNMEKTLNNTNAEEAKKNVSDIQFFGDGDTFKLICKASSKEQGWMKSTKAMQIDGVGCVVQVTTQQNNRTGAMVFEYDEKGGFIKNDPTDNSSSLKQSHAIDCAIAETITFVPGVKISEIKDSEGKVTGRKLVAL